MPHDFIDQQGSWLFGGGGPPELHQRREVARLVDGVDEFGLYLVCAVALGVDTPITVPAEVVGVLVAVAFIAAVLEVAIFQDAPTIDIIKTASYFP